ncbi:MAG: FtsX-like permease family protein [FCB group bacterium]|nr:FtsX-like permease family protein [FCB group bacterium]
MADQLFGDDPAFGQTLRTGNGYDLKVTGVIKDLPDNTHFQFDAISSIATLESEARANQPENSTQPIWLENWWMIAMPTYARFVEGASNAGLDEKITAFTREHDVSENFLITLQPLLDVHLKSTDIIFDSVKNKGDIKVVYTFAAIALLILVIAAVNYINLSTARSTRRAKEVGMRKVVGSDKSQLVIQFLGESLIITVIALILALFIAYNVLPWMNDLAGTSMTLDLPHNAPFIAFLFGMLIIVGLCAGIYPALVLSKFKPVTVLKGSFKSGKKGSALRKILVVVQFSLSMALICITVLIQKQMYYVQHKNLGYEREHVLILDMLDRSMSKNIGLMRDELINHSSVASAGAASNVPGRTFSRTGIRPEGASEDDIWVWSSLGLGYEALTTLGMELAWGRNFNPEMPTDTVDAVIVNETAVNKLGWEEPYSKKLYFGQSDSIGTRIVGVVKDFHFAGLHQNIEPVVIFPLGADPGGLLAVRINKGQIDDGLGFIENKWNELYPSHPFNYSFLDDEFDNLYRRDINTSKIVNIFAMLAIFVACLGLFGLVSHSTEQRTKEIAVRKILGARMSGIVTLVFREFAILVTAACIIAVPFAWYAMNKWLENFAYKTDISWWIFFSAAMLTILITFLTVGYQSIKAASNDPANSLRYE